MVFSTLEYTISNDNSIRFIDAFVDTVNLHTLGFTVKTLKNEGLQKVVDEHSLIILVYNIKSTINLLEVSDLIAKLLK